MRKTRQKTKVNESHKRSLIDNYQAPFILEAGTLQFLQLHSFCYTGTMKHKIAILDNVRLLPETQAQIKNLTGNPLVFPDDSQTSEDELIIRTNDAEAVLVSPFTKITQTYLNACPSVKYICLCGTSTANIDLEALTSRSIAFTNVADYGDEPTAEFIFMQLTALARGVGKYQWKDMPHELMGKSIGIIGLGALGKAIAHLALAYRMQVSYFSTHRKPDWEARGLHFNALPAVLASNEIIVLSTPTNVKILGEKEFTLLQPNSILVQASIGCPFDKDAFYSWIEKDNNYAIFDYGVGEDDYQKYKDIPRVIISKATSGYSYETRQRLGQRVIENLQRYFSRNS